ncbi:MAG: acetyl-CoA carboxylase biotin carboxyl carrier protein subunit [Bacteroidales bacterium]|nr:acetyl-CoA carboxylase biotin carboxyl carrier protein subunit [Candidatus Cryptobacteroides aphodequi]
MKEYKFRINGNEYNVAVNSIEGTNASVTVNGTEYNVEMDAPLAPKAPAKESVKAAAEAPVATAPATPAAPAGKGLTVTSPLPGVIIGIDAREGAPIRKGQRIAVLEAMKMENDILAEADGTVTKIFVSKGDSVLEGADIATIA